MIIAISGKIGSGKDTTAEYLVNALDKYFKSGIKILKFAGHLKRMVSALTNCSMYDLESQEFKKTEFIEGITYRKLLQTLGAEWGRDLIDKDFWIKCTFKEILDNINGNYIITDLRYKNEINSLKEFAKKHNIKLIAIRINRDSSIVSDHSSEIDLDSYTDWDFVIDNNRSKMILYALLWRLKKDILRKLNIRTKKFHRKSNLLGRLYREHHMRILRKKFGDDVERLDNSLCSHRKEYIICNYISRYGKEDPGGIDSNTSYTLGNYICYWNLFDGHYYKKI